MGDQAYAPQRSAGRGRAAWAVLLVALVLAAAVADSPAIDLPLSYEVWTFNIGVRDVLTVVLLGAGLAGKPWRSLPRGYRLAVAAFALLVVVGTAATVLLVGLQYGVVRWREWLLALAFLVFATAHAPGRWGSIRSGLVAAAVAVALFQLFALFLGGWAWDAAERAYGSGADAFYGARPILAPTALLLLAGFCLVVTGDARPRWGRSALAVLLGCSVVLAQHRSVWIALIAALPMLAWSLRRSTAAGPKVAVAVVGGFLAIAVAVPVATGFSILPGGSGGAGTQAQSAGGEGADGAGASADGAGVEVEGEAGSAAGEGVEDGAGIGVAATSTGSLRWRVAIWKSRLEADRSPTQWVLGSVLGPTPVNAYDSTVLYPRISGHSTPLDLLTTVGLAGLVIAVGLWVAALRTSYPSDRGLWAALGSLAGYGIFYMVPPWSWALIGSGLVAGSFRGPAARAGAGGGGATAPEQRGPDRQQDQARALGTDKGRTGR